MRIWSIIIQFFCSSKSGGTQNCRVKGLRVKINVIGNDGGRQEDTHDLSLGVKRTRQFTRGSSIDTQPCEEPRSVMIYYVYLPSLKSLRLMRPSSLLLTPLKHHYFIRVLSASLFQAVVSDSPLWLMTVNCNITDLRLHDIKQIRLLRFAVFLHTADSFNNMVALS